MSVYGRAAAALAFTLLAGPALAHPPPLGIPGFFGGALHPLFVPAHMLAIAGLSLLIGQQMPAWGGGAPFALVAALAGGLGGLALGLVPMLVGEALLALAVVTGGLVAWARPLPEAAGVALAGATGLAVGLDSPPELVSLREANLMLIGTAFGGTLATVALVGIASQLRRHWLRIGARILGSWIAASAILVLALRLVR